MGIRRPPQVGRGHVYCLNKPDKIQTSGSKLAYIAGSGSSYLTDTGVEWGLIMAMGTVIVTPLFHLYSFAAKQIIAIMFAETVKEKMIANVIL